MTDTDVHNKTHFGSMAVRLHKTKFNQKYDLGHKITIVQEAVLDPQLCYDLCLTRLAGIV